MNRLRRFMYGRYGGSDGLNLFLIIASFAILIISTIFGAIAAIPQAVPIVLRIISAILIVLAILRMLSKNINARRNEAYAFSKAARSVKSFFKKLFIPRPDRKTHKYYRCPVCSQQVRVPKGKGKIAIKCPKCGNKFIRTT